MTDVIRPFLIGATNVGPYPMDANTTSNVVNPVLLAVPEWNDINCAVNTAKHPGTNNPTPGAITTNTSLYSFAENDYVDLETIELLHDWAEGTTIHPHMHYIVGAEDGTDRTMKFTLYSTLVNVNGVMSAEHTQDTGTITIPANTPLYTCFLVDFEPDIDMTGYKIGAQLNMRLKRTATAGTDPSVNPSVLSVGIHYQINSLGSRGIGTK